MRKHVLRIVVIELYFAGGFPSKRKVNIFFKLKEETSITSQNIVQKERNQGVLPRRETRPLKPEHT
jgi:hypothetical protein